MKEIILDRENIESLPQIMRSHDETSIGIFFPDYFYPQKNHDMSVPEFNEKNIRIIQEAKKIACERGISVFARDRSYSYIVPGDLERDDFSTASLVYENDVIKKPLVSVIISANNRRDYLHRTLKALAEQSLHEEFEVIVADDASSDGTDKMIREETWPFRIKHVYWPRVRDFEPGTPTNRVGPLRNLAVRYSLGKILVFLDADIVVNENCLSYYVQSCDEKSVVVAPSIREVEGVDKREDYFSICGDDIDRLTVKWTLLHSGNFCVYKCNFDAVGGFDKDFVFYGKEDEEIGYRFYRLGLHFKLERKAYGIHLYHEPEFINETLKKVMHIYQVRIFYKKHLDKDIFDRFNHRVSPHLVKVGKSCNNNCRHCHRLEKKSFREKGTDELKEELRISRENGFSVVLGGGEPAIREDFSSLLAFANRLGVEVEVLTNARVFSRSEYMKPLADNDIRHVMVYLYDSDEVVFDQLTGVQGSYKQSLKGIMKLVKHRFTVAVTVVINEDNFCRLEQMVSLCTKLAVNTIHLRVLPDLLFDVDILYIADTIRKLQLRGYNIIVRDQFINCLNSNKNFKHSIDREESCSRCDMKERCAFERAFVFVRIDDVEHKTPLLTEMVGLLIDNAVPVSFQVIPKTVTEECADWLSSLKNNNPGLVEIGQHGWAHRNYDETLEENFEFGSSREYEAQYRDIKRGKDRMLTLFGDHFDEVFTPPYHGHNRTTLRVLEEVGFKKLYLGSRTKISSTKLIVRSFSFDPLEYEKGKGNHKPLSQIKDEVSNRGKHTPLRITLHPQYLEEKTLTLMRWLIKRHRQHSFGVETRKV